MAEFSFPRLPINEEMAQPIIPKKKKKKESGYLVSWPTPRKVKEENWESQGLHGRKEVIKGGKWEGKRESDR